jgi:acyl-CoA reductase-like NAD-dependent aldehyde dehydrogenase
MQKMWIVQVTAAKAAFDGEWGATGPTARGKLMVKLAEIIEREAGAAWRDRSS